MLTDIDEHWPGDAFSLVSLANFPYVRRVIEESLRLYPTIWSIGRRCTATDQLAGYDVPVGMNVVIPIFHFHWHENFWPEPQRFEPDRFLPERRPASDAMTYFPFGAGPRSCIGNHFAIQELMIMTVLFFRRFRFQVEEGFKVEAEPLITLCPKNGLRMVVQQRKVLCK